MSEQDRTDAGPQVHGRMAFDERETLMAYLLRHPGVYAEARQVLTPEHFTESFEIIWAIVWRSCMDLSDQYGALPPQGMLETDALARIAEHPGEVPPEGVTELRNFMEYIFDFDVSLLFSPEYQQYGYDLLHRFLKERHWTDPVRRFIQELGDAVPVDVPNLLEDFKNRYAQVQGASATVMEDLVPIGGLEEEALHITSTGFTFLDEPMGGGAADGECYGLLGTYGSGKTMLACGIGAEAATRCVREAVKTRKLPRHVFHFTYETPPNDIRKRVIAYLAQIKLDNLNQVPYAEHLSKTGRRHAYEEEMFPTDPRGEWERYNDTRSIWQTYHIANMTGPRSNPKAGSGGIEEIAAELEKFHTRWRFIPDTVIIDYALVCVRRFIKAKGWDVDRKLRHLVGEFGDECRRLIASRYGCRVWILNQLSGQANRRAPGARMSHADSAEATNFAENLWYAFCLGNKNPESNTVVIECTKKRRSEGTNETSVLELRGDMARFVTADSRYMIDPNTNRIVKKSVGEVVAPSSSSGGRGAQPRRHGRRNGPADAISPIE